MRLRFLIPLLLLGALVPPVLFVLFVLDGAGSFGFDVAYTADGRILHQHTVTGIGRGTRAFWNEVGVLDEGRSGHFRFGLRMSRLSADEVRDLTVGRGRLDADINTMISAAHEFALGPYGYTVSSPSEKTALAKRIESPASFSHVLAYEPTRKLLRGSETAIADPWGRRYELRVDPPSSSFADAKRITVFTRGADGLPGGEGDRADYGLELDSDGERSVEHIP